MSTLSGFGGFPQRQTGVGFLPTFVSSLVAAWSSVGATRDEAPNQSLVSSVESMTPVNVANRPELYGLSDGSNVLRFTGALNATMRTVDVAALRNQGPRNCWAMHLRITGSMPANLNIYSQRGTTPRASIIYTPLNERLIFTLAGIPNRFQVARSTMAHGPWIVFKNDGDALTNQGKLRLFIDDGEIGSLSIGGTNPSSLPAGDATHVWLASDNGASCGTLDSRSFYVYDDIPTDEELLLTRYYQPPPWELDTSADDGNSITRGQSNGVDASYPALMRPLVALGMGVHNFGVSGHTTPQRTTAFPTGVHALYRDGRENTVCFFEVGNQALAGADAATCLASLAAYFDQAASLGWTVRLGTCPPRAVGSIGWTAGMQAVVNAVNAAVRANPSPYCHRLVELAADPRLSNPNDATIYFDGTHTTPLANAIIASLYASDIRAEQMAA